MAPEQTKTMLTGKRVVVCGGGPAGMVAAMQLARHGATVDVYESREEDFKRSPNSWIIVLSGRGIRSLHAAGISTDAVSPSMRCVGIGIHHANGKSDYSPGWGKDVEMLGSDQASLSRFVQRSALEAHPAAIKLHFACKLIRGDLESRALQFERVVSGERFMARGDLIVGADGGHSVVRGLMEKQVSGFEVDRCEHFSAGLSVVFPSLSDVEFSISHGTPLALFPPEPPGKDWIAEGWAIAFVLPANPLRSGPMLISVSPDRCVEAGWFLSRTFFDSSHTEESLRALLTANYPRVPLAIVNALAKAASAAPNCKVRRVPTSIKCTRISASGVVLVGDAAHCVSPSLGQGAQSALEDSLVLSQAIVEADGDIEQMCTIYNRLRLADVHALVDLDRWAVTSMRRAPGVFPPLKLLRQCMLKSDRVLAFIFAFLPDRVRPSAIDVNLRKGVLTYSQVKRRVLVKFGVVVAILALAVACAMLKLTPQLSRLQYCTWS